MSIRPEIFKLISDIVLKRVGIMLPPGKEYLVESRLGPVMTSFAIKSFDELAVALGRGNPELLNEVLDALTTNETFFFRDKRVFDTLQDQILPDIIETQRAKRELVIWCGASSSGQESLSLAMMLREKFPEVSSWRLRIIATDISDSMLARCRGGLYSQLEVSRGLPSKLLVKYFRKKGMKWEVAEDIRNMISYRKMNLLHPFPAMPMADLVMMRNVLIYFEDAVKEDILNRTRRIMQPHSYLLLGAGEFVRGGSYSRVKESEVCYFKAA